MARLSPITIGMATLMVGVLCAAVFLVLRPRHAVRGDAPELVQLPAPAPPVAERTVAPPATPSPRRSPEPIPAPEPALAVETPPAGASEPESPEPRPPVQPASRPLLVVNHNRRMQEADEQVFAALNLPDSTRAAVRLINEEYRKRTERDAEAVAGGGGGTSAPGAAEARAALDARRDALVQLLGGEPARQFDAAERGAVQRLRGKYRFQWGRQLRE